MANTAHKLDDSFDSIETKDKTRYERMQKSKKARLHRKELKKIKESQWDQHLHEMK